MLLGIFHMTGQVSPRKQTAVNFWMKRFYAAVHHFRKFRDGRNGTHRHPGLLQRDGSAAGRNNFHGELVQ